MTHSIHNPPPKKQRLFYGVQVISALLGLVASLYLFVHHTQVKSGIQEGSSFCSLGKFADCDVVNASAYSEVGGLPLAAIGACFFFLLLALGMFATPQDPNFEVSQRFQAWFASLALLGDLFLLVVVQGFILKTFCIVCFFTYLTTAAHLFANYKMAPVTGRNWVKRFESLLLGNGQWKLKKVSWIKLVPVGVATACFVLVLILLPSWVRSKSTSYTRVDSAVEQFFATWKDKPVKDLALKPTDATFGNPQAKVKMVIFSDFQCPYCRKAAFVFHTVLRGLENKVSLTFKNYPLDSTCNSRLTYQMHPYACRLAQLSYCANQKGKFWDFHDLVFLKIDEETFKEDFESVVSALKGIFTPEEVKACLANPASLQSVKQDIEVANGLGLRGTPTVYVQGRLLDVPLNNETLTRLVQSADSMK